CTRHTFSVQFAFEILQSTHFEVISEKGETRSDVSPFKRVNVGDIRLPCVQDQPDFREAHR
ncbi:hypothetical protein PS030_28045, partial [Shigella sonnei]|nr:hypothetical protein [Shigella sonnei]